MKGKVRVVKLISGEFMVGEVGDNDNILKKPYIINFRPTQQQNGLAAVLIPSMYPIDIKSHDELNIKDIILYDIGEADESLRREYLKTITGIEIVPSGTQPKNQKVVDVKFK